MARRAVFLDRDGTLLQIIHRPSHPKKLTAAFSMEEYRLEEDIHHPLADLADAGFMRILITNQPDVAHGYVSEGVWWEIFRKFLAEAPLDDWYMCRHTTENHCPCKKPSSVMLRVAADKHGIDLSQSFMVGDSEDDMLAGQKAGCKTILLVREYNMSADADFRVRTIREASQIILGGSK